MQTLLIRAGEAVTVDLCRNTCASIPTCVDVVHSNVARSPKAALNASTEVNDFARCIHYQSWPVSHDKGSLP